MNNTRNIFWALVRSDFLIRYQHSALGFLWVFLKPFFIFVVLLGVFSFFGQGIDYYPLYLLLGLLYFQFFSDGTSFGMRSLLDRSSLLRQIQVPSQACLLSALVNAAVHLCLGMGFFLVAHSFLGPSLDLTVLPSFLLLFSALLLFALGTSFFLSVGIVYFRDLGEIWDIVLVVLFYLTPIFYPLEIVPSFFRTVLWYNPLTPLIEYSRTLLLSPVQEIPWGDMGILFVILLFFCCGGWLFFRRSVPSLIQKL